MSSGITIFFKQTGCMELFRFATRKKISKIHAIAAIAGLFLVSAGSCAWQYWHLTPARAASDSQKWKGFEEDFYGFTMRYPSAWSIDYDYDRYAKGLMHIALDNKPAKKQKTQSAVCAPDAVDLHFFVGYKPQTESETGGPDLKSQLYREIELIKDSGNFDLVESLNINNKEAFKVKSDDPTLSLNGVCAGPLYLIDLGGNAFAYIFAGMGSDARVSGEETIRQMISSMKIDEKLKTGVQK